jgi:hypothetical protein
LVWAGVAAVFVFLTVVRVAVVTIFGADFVLAVIVTVLLWGLERVWVFVELYVGVAVAAVVVLVLDTESVSWSAPTAEVDPVEIPILAAVAVPVLTIGAVTAIVAGVAAGSSVSNHKISVSTGSTPSIFYRLDVGYF